MADMIASGDPDHERLPWLESAEPEPEPARPVWRTVLVVLIGLLMVGTIAFALLRHRGAPTASGTGDLIAAPEGPYKTRPQKADGLRVTGDSDTAIATGICNPHRRAARRIGSQTATITDTIFTTNSASSAPSRAAIPAISA